MKIEPGRRLGAYVVLSKIGEGGMGEVYRARDESLGRVVALKVLPSRFAGPEARARFEREARLLASLNHPNIAAIFGFEEAEGVRFAVLEMIEGATLGALLRRGPLETDEALRIALEIAGALEAAHAKRIVHRDLKPENVRITPDGRVKVLDFGIARTVSADRDEGDPETLPTLAAGLTAAGTLLGTPGYLSPEQARGLTTDERADLWAFGCVLYEMLASRRAFPGATAADALAATLKTPPEWGALSPSVPPEIVLLLERCLEKEASRREVTASEAREGIAAALEARRSGSAGPVPSRLTQLTFDDELEGMPAWSPDGAEVVFVREAGGVRKIHRVSVGEGEASRVTGGDRDDILPSWSPDGRTLLFVRGRAAGRRLEPGDLFGAYDDADVWSRDLDSGKETLWLAAAYNPSWSPDGDRVAVDASFAGPRRIWMVDARGRNPQQISSDASEAVAHVRPRWSPDGRRLVYQRVERTRFTVAALDVVSRESIIVTDSMWADLHPVWSPSGRWIYFSSYRSGGLNIWRVPVRAGGEPAGPPQQVTAGAGQDLEMAISPGSGRMAFSILKQNASIWVLPVDPASGRPQGSPRKLVATSREDSRAAWSRDGRLLAFNSDRSGDMNLWTCNPSTGATRQITRGPGGDYQADWSPDGRFLAFFSSREGTPGIWTVAVDSGALACLSPKGVIEINPFFSPDGRLIAFQSDRDGRLEVWVMGKDGSGPRQLTTTGVTGHFLRWTRDGRFVVYRSPGGGKPATLRVPIEGGDPEAMGEIAGGAHMSFSPDASSILDVVAHKTLHVSRIGGTSPERVFEFEDSEVRIDYPVWSPDGKLISFDRFVPRGSDVWTLEGFG